MPGATSSAAAALLIALDTGAWAAGQLPLQTDVPDSPAKGAFELDVAFGIDRVALPRAERRERRGRSRLDLTVPIILFDYGVTDRIQARIDGAVGVTRLPGGSTDNGVGDISVGVKYRFLDQAGGTEDEEPEQKAGTSKEEARQLTHDGSEEEDRFAWEGPVSASIFPQWSFPTGPAREGIRDAEYSLFLPVDVGRDLGKLQVVGEGAFLWRYHQRAAPNEFEIGTAAFYDVTPKWELLGEQRVNLPTVGHGTAEWLFNLGARYEVNDHFAFFGSSGRSFRASSRIEERTYMVLIGFEVTHGPKK